MKNIQSKSACSILLGLCNGQEEAPADSAHELQGHLSVAVSQTVLAFLLVTDLLDHLWALHSFPSHHSVFSTSHWSWGMCLLQSFGFLCASTLRMSSLHYSPILSKSLCQSPGWGAVHCSWCRLSSPMLKISSATAMRKDFCVSQGSWIWKDGIWSWSQLGWGTTCPLSLSKSQSHWKAEPSAHGALRAVLWGGHSSMQSVAGGACGSCSSIMGELEAPEDGCLKASTLLQLN